MNQPSRLRILSYVSNAPAPVIDLEGDRPIKIDEHFLTTADAAFLARIPEKSVYNWRHRKVLQIGRREWISGRWLFSICDVLRLAVLHDLCIRWGLSLYEGAQIAGYAVQLAFDATERDASGRLVGKGEKNLLISRDDEGTLRAGLLNVREPGLYLPPPGREDDLDHRELLRSAHICLPVSSLFADVILRTQHLPRENARREAPVPI